MLRPKINEASDAMASAGKTLVELFGLARELNANAEGIEMGPSFKMQHSLQIWHFLLKILI
ncbi:DNA-directed RNA polymerase subunit alpha [Actinomycetota bacterium]|nr:DNA-directed RNA polymerase subunit alpha [Actinomycetota bacterium]